MNQQTADKIFEHLEDVEASPMVLVRMKARLNSLVREDESVLHRCLEIDCPYCYSEEIKKEIALRKIEEFQEENEADYRLSDHAICLIEDYLTQQEGDE